MATLDSLQFEMERRIVIFTWQTTLPDDTSLGYNSDPNLISSPTTPGETLLYNAPVSTRYAELDASADVSQEWFKQAKPSVWEMMGSGSDASLNEIEARLDIIDASITTLDSSVTDLYSITGTLDSSVTDLYSVTATLDSSVTDLYDKKVDRAGDTMTGDLTVTGVSITNDLSVGGGASIIGNVEIGGDLTVDGSTVFIHTTELDVSTNFINLNTGLTGTPPSWLQSGIVVERGDEDPYLFIFDETNDTFRIGIASPADASGVFPDASTQAVSTREDNPIDKALAIWNDVANRFDTSAGLTFDNNDGLYVDGSIKVSSLAGSGIRAVVVNDDGTLDTSTFSSSVDIKNIGTGDASVYYGIDGGSYSFREIKSIDSQIIVDVSNNIITIDASISAPLGEAIDGGVWITDITPTSGGNVGDKVTSSDGNVLDSCLTDVSALTVHVLALPGHTNYKPIVTINDVSVSLAEGDNQPLWTGTYVIEYDFADASITAVHEDGANWSTTVEADTPAAISSAVFINGYPGSQTELKAGDTFDVSIMTDVSISSVIVDNFGAATGGTYPVSGNNVGFTITIADRGDTVQALGLRLRVVKATGSTSANYLTSSQGAVDGTDLVNVNDIHPSITYGTITYPATQSALKASETATVVNTVTDYTTISYTSPNGDLSIASPTVYATPKTVTRIGGTYNISTNNLNISANRAANNATSTNSEVVWIASIAPTLSVSNPASRLRSGGSDGTSAQNHTITIGSNQRLQAAPTLVDDTGGTWQGGGFSWSASAISFTRQLQVVDSESKGSFTWGAISGTGLAGLSQSSNSGDTTYVLGGFVNRTITVAAFGTSAQINVEISDYSKIASTLAWTVKALTIKRALGTTATPDAGAWAASGSFANPTTINILDTQAAASSSQASTFTIQESI